MNATIKWSPSAGGLCGGVRSRPRDLLNLTDNFWDQNSWYQFRVNRASYQALAQADTSGLKPERHDHQSCPATALSERRTKC